MRRVMWGIAVLAMAFSTFGTAWAAVPASQAADLTPWDATGTPWTVGTALGINIGAKNAGPDAAHGLKVRVRFSPAYFKYSGTPESQCALRSGSVVVCRFGTVGPTGSSLVYSGIFLTPLKAGTGRLAITVLSNTRDPNPANNTLIQKIPID